ncbi:MAG: helicase-related protein, partial [Limisphaerales bacterium]
KTDPGCRVFLSTDSGSTGLNLQNASVVINCDLPWNPAKLEQRIARAWRKLQTRPVTVINLVSENTIEHRMLQTLSNKQALADGVLDLKGDLRQIKLRTGRQAFLAKLEQIVSVKPASAAPDNGHSDADSPLPADRSLGFVRKAQERINGALVHCEERYPAAGPHSVLYVVVDRDPAQFRERLNEVHGELFGVGKSDPLAPVQLEVVDRATHDALERLAAAGLISLTIRATRQLFPQPGAPSGPPPLTTEEKAAVAAHRAGAARKLKMASLLGGGGLVEEARAALLEAVLLFGRALAVEARVPQPASTEEALLPPLSHGWADALPVLRPFAAEPASAWEPVFECLEKHSTQKAANLA